VARSFSCVITRGASKLNVASSSPTNPNVESWQTYLSSPNNDDCCIDLARIIGIQEDQSFDEGQHFPLFEKLIATTDGRVHNFSVACDDIMKFIKMGAINKQIALQYCHYLVNSIKRCKEEDRDYYNQKSHELVFFLLKYGKELPQATKATLLCHFADVSESNCKITCEYVTRHRNLFEASDDYHIFQLLRSCHKFGLWTAADDIVGIFDVNRRVLNVRLFDALIDKLVKISEKQGHVNEQASIQNPCIDLFNHLKKLLKLCSAKRIQFITGRPKEFASSLQNLGLKVVTAPSIKTSGRCTCCNTHIPIYDKNFTRDLNNSIRGLLERKVLDDTLLFTSPNDWRNFKDFLENVNDINRRPIDCVIDGLNIAYKNNSGYAFKKRFDVADTEVVRKVPSPSRLAQVLINTIIRGDLLQMFKKIVVIGRKHMLDWPGVVEFFERNRIHYYLSHNQSKDDLFQLYASTLHPKTLLISNDFFRDHRSLLPRDDRTKLERWIDTHQVWISNKSLRPIWPTPYEKIPSVSEDGRSFHVPVIDFNRLDDISLHEPPPHLNNKMLTWLCCSDPKDSKSDQDQVVSETMKLSESSDEI